MRLDQWLWFARFYKTRSLATEALKAGHVKVDGQRCKPAKEVVCGTVLTIVRGGETWVVTVTGLPTRRGPATEAQACYSEDPAAAAARDAERAERRLSVQLPPSPGRPDKRTRRLIRSRRRGD
jgi:ribosome-associated heat shock protein Hsp15